MNPSRAAAGAILTIDLEAIRDNYRQLKMRLHGAECGAVVKADSYGLDAVGVASALHAEGCRSFFVAQASEGILLRHALGPSPSIYLLNGIHPGAEMECARSGLVAVANSLEQLAAWREAAQLAGRLPVAVQVDSGMSRLGMSLADVETLDARAFDRLDLVLVMSHLACADEPENPANRVQLAAFEAIRKMLPPAPASLANSSGIFLGDAYHYDLARPGAALYGINPIPGNSNPMRQPITLEAKVIQTRELVADIGIGYGHAYRTTGPLRTATIAIGYADGWPRRAETSAWFDGVRLPFVGRVSMDSIVIDISALPAGRLKGGDLVELIGTHQSVDDLAQSAGTIGYEILTGLGGRFHRIQENG